MKIEIIKSAENNPVAEFFSSSTTPETDKFKIKLKTLCGEKYWVPVEHSERLELGRAEAREDLEFRRELYALQTERLQRIELERDEAREELEEYRSIAENMGAKKAVSEKEKAIKERDEARKAIIATLEANRHLADGDDCTLAKLKSVVPDWK